MNRTAKLMLTTCCLIAITRVDLAAQISVAGPTSHYERPSKKGGPFKDRAIVFVHGLFSDANGAWTSPSGAYWPKMLLSDPDFDDFDIYVANYPSPSVGNTLTVDEVVVGLNSRFVADGVFTKHREVVFVCHSLGGIVVQQLFLTFREYAGKVPFIYLFSVPEEGAQIATLGRLFSSDPLLEALFHGNSNGYLLTLESQWRAAHFGIRRYCAYEKKPLKGTVLIVDRLSATRNCDEPAIPINEDHFGVVKPNNPEHPSYVALSNAIKQLPAAASPRQHRSADVPLIGEPVGHGVLVGSVSMLDVGALPPDQTATPDPPDWVEPPTDLKLLFQDSPMLTDVVRKQITRDISAFREYLLRLGIPASGEFPTIGVGTGSRSAQLHLLQQKPTYRSDAKITEGWLTDRRVITAQYADYAIAAALEQRAEGHPTVSTLQDTIATSALSRYYNWSFWNRKPEAETGYWSIQLWEIRDTFGKEFTDKLAAFALRSMLDDPDEGADANFDVYFYRKLQIADSVIDNNAEKMGQITAIIEKLSINVTKPTAELDFAATARRRRDGSFLVDVRVNNKSDVAANDGQVRMYFAPDVRLVREPQASSKDPSTTLESARRFTLKPLAAHSSTGLQVEFRLIGDPPEGKLFVHFDYWCTECANDTYSHELKFNLNRTPTRAPLDAAGPA